MQVALVAGSSENREKRLMKAVKKVGLKISRKPDVVISYGGDGTILMSEHRFPGVPKLVIKDSEICHKCEYRDDDIEGLLTKLKKKEYEKTYERKLQCGKLRALNEFHLHNANPSTAIRFSTKINGKVIVNIIGDGAIVCTAFGSGGYYLSAGGRTFKKGTGFILNNPHNTKRKARILDEDSAIVFRVQRGPALLCYDNVGCLAIGEGERVEIRRSKDKACFIKLL
jgi:NAD kinase